MAVHVLGLPHYLIKFSYGRPYSNVLFLFPFATSRFVSSTLNACSETGHLNCSAVVIGTLQVGTALTVHSAILSHY